MLLKQFFNNFLCIICFNTIFCSRRIYKGKPTVGDKKYMVYFLKSSQSKKTYDSWLCGGSLVTPSKILTAAACLAEMTHLYVIAGYRRYVNAMDIELDECTKNMKQRVVHVHIPKAYNLNYENTVDWVTLDIGVATVEKPYNSSDLTYKMYCSYIPVPININYDKIFEGIGTNVFALGWGHLSKMRKPWDTQDYNVDYLHEAPTLIAAKTLCKKHFIQKGMTELIDKYMICTSGAGIMDSDGNVGIGDTNRFGCRRSDGNLTNCIDDDYFQDEDFRRKESSKSENGTQQTELRNNPSPMNKTRRQGICQNDHGGPLVAWVGSSPLLLGVASVALYTSSYECAGPYLFTSTSCTGQILQCLLHMDDAPQTQQLCSDIAREEGYIIEENQIDWENNSEGTHTSEDPPKDFL